MSDRSHAGPLIERLEDRLLLSAHGVVNDSDVHHYAFEPIDDPQTVAETIEVIVTARDLDGAVIGTHSGPADLSAHAADGPVPIEVDGPCPPSGESGTDVHLVDPVNWNPAPPTPGVYHSYDELTSALAWYALEHPAIARMYTIGQSVEGRHLWAMKITDRPDVEEFEPEVKYVASMHGDEPVAMELCLNLVELLLAGADEPGPVAEVVGRMEIWVLPLMNPDGLEANSRYNARGMDLNRAFPDGAVTDIGDVLHGPAMDLDTRQPEVSAVMSWSASQRFVASANFHSGALVVNYPYDNDGQGSVFSPTDDEDLLRHISLTYASLNPPMAASSRFAGGVTNGAAWYSMTGGMQDWNYRYLGTNAVTVELGDTKRPPVADLPELWDDNRSAMLAYLQSAEMGVRGLVTDAASGLPVSAAVRVEGRDHNVFTDPDVGDYHRMLLPGTYDLRFTAPGYLPAVVEDVSVSAGVPTRLDVELSAAPVGIQLVGGMWTGQVKVDRLAEDVRLSVIDEAGRIGQSNAFDVQADPGNPDMHDAPTGVALSAESDTGVLDSDGLTRLNNVSPAVAPRFRVTGTVAGAVVTVYVDGVAIGSAEAHGEVTVVVADGTTGLADGPRAVTARQSLPGGAMSAEAPACEMVIDTQPPAVTAWLRNGGVDRPELLATLGVTFTEPVVAASTAMSLWNQTLDTPVDVSAGSFGYDGAQRTALWDLLAVDAPAGRYRVTIGWDVADWAGNVLNPPAIEDLLVAVTGDANLDGRVDVGDLGILAAHWQRTEAHWGQGDFTHDGRVDVGDLGRLAWRYGADVNPSAKDGMIDAAEPTDPLRPASGPDTLAWTARLRPDGHIGRADPVPAGPATARPMAGKLSRGSLSTAGKESSGRSRVAAGRDVPRAGRPDVMNLLSLPLAGVLR